jgi:hypothetical protein
MNPFGIVDKILLVLLAVAIVAFGFEYAHVQEVRRQLAEAATEMAKYKESVAETTRLLQASSDRAHAAQLTQVQEALNAATTRNTKLAADAAGVQSRLDRLRSAVRLAARRDSVPNAAAAPADQPVSTTGQLLLECGQALADMAAAADRERSDKQTLIDAWPK